MTKFKVNGLQIQYGDKAGYIVDGLRSIYDTNKLKGSVNAGVDGAKGKVQVDIETLSEGTQKRLDQLLKDIQDEINGELKQSNDENDVTKLNNTGLAILHKNERILTEKQAKELMDNVNKKSLKDQAVKFTVNIDYAKAEENSKELATKMTDMIWKAIEDAINKGKSLK